MILVVHIRRVESAVRIAGEQRGARRCAAAGYGPIIAPAIQLADQGQRCVPLAQLLQAVKRWPGVIDARGDDERLSELIALA